jgi:hypothetical protein
MTFELLKVCRQANPAWIELWVMYVRSTVTETINDCHTSGGFDPPFSWEMPVPSREYDSCFLVSHMVMF